MPIPHPFFPLRLPPPRPRPLPPTPTLLRPLLPLPHPLPARLPPPRPHRPGRRPRARPHPAARRKYTYATQTPGGREVKWTAEEKPRTGERALKWEAELVSPNPDGFDRKWKWETKSKPGASSAAASKTKWATEIKGKGSLEPWSHAYTWEEEDFSSSDDDNEEELYYRHRKLEIKEKKKKNKDKAAKEDDKKEKKKNKCGGGNVSVRIEEIPEDNTAGCVAIRKDAALLIQMNYRAHLAHRSQVLRCLRDLAVAKAKLKELRSMFYNLSYRRRIAHDHEERQRFSEKIIVLLLTVDALEQRSLCWRSWRGCWTSWTRSQRGSRGPSAAASLTSQRAEERSWPRRRPASTPARASDRRLPPPSLAGMPWLMESLALAPRVICESKHHCFPVISSMELAVVCTGVCYMLCMIRGV